MNLHSEIFSIMMSFPVSYAQNFYALLNEDESMRYEMMDFMENSLEEARIKGEKVIIVGHIPPGMYSLDDFSLWLNDLMVQYSDLIVLHVYGHTHRDHYTLVGSSLLSLDPLHPFLFPSKSILGELRSHFYVHSCLRHKWMCVPSKWVQMCNGYGCKES